MDGNSDIAGKISELLSDEESLQQLRELAQMFAEENGGDGSSPPPEGAAPDLGGIMKLAGLAGAASKNDSSTELLLALRPHLGRERQERVDKAVKLLRLLAVWEMAKESGLLNDML